MRSIILKYTLAVTFLGAIASCDKKLDLQPQQSVDATVALTTPDDVESAVVGAYSIMGGGSLYGTNLFMLADLQASENYVSWRGTFQSPRQIALKTQTRDNTDAALTWAAAYRTINMTNVVLNALSVVTDAAQKNKLEGEALCIRGMMHFELVRFYALPWGATTNNDHLGIVNKTAPTNTEAEAFTQAPRNTVAQVYQQVISDLTAASSKLPADNGTRIDRFTALAFLARVYLQQGDYTKARDAANSVIASGKYALNASVTAVFNNKNTSESIWEIQQNDQNNAGTANNGLATFYASFPGIGRADIRLIAAFLNTYNPSDRRLLELFYVGTGARPGNIYTRKWNSFSQNLPVIRIAEMYLTRAEANIRLGTTVGDTPANDLAKISNPIRTNLAINAAPTLNDVIAQRFLELAFEGVRIHDLKRLRLTTGAFAWNDPKLVFPIPNRDVQAASGVLVQNPGY